MSLYNNHLEKEFCKIEKKIKVLAIPIFIVICVLFLTPFPIKDPADFYKHIISSVIGIIFIWFEAQWIIIKIRKHLPNIKNKYRLTLQLCSTILIAVVAVYVLVILSDKYIYTTNCHYISSNDMKNLVITTILFTLLINTIYEGFYLFVKLTRNATETERYKKESIEAQYKNLTSRLNPHFLFNSLNTLVSIVEDEPQKAVLFIQELSKVYRYVLNSHNHTWVSMEQELRFTRSYIQLLKMRFENNLVIQLDHCENHSALCILPMTIQLLLENAVKHNEISNSHKLVVKLFCKDDHFVIHNVKQKRNILPSSTKTGLQNIKDRYIFLVNKQVIIEDEQETFTVKIPLIKISTIPQIDKKREDEGINYRG